MSEGGRYAYAGLDRRLHEPARLSILTALITHPQGLAFAELRAACDLTDGNLASHVRHLETAGYLASEKRIEAGRPVTRCRITGDGQRRFLDYLAVLKDVIRDASVTDRPARRVGSSPKPA